MPAAKIEKILTRLAASKQVHEYAVLIENAAGDFTYSKTYGGKGLDTPFLLASVTKLFTTACILSLKESGKIRFSDPLEAYFSRGTLHELQVYRGTDYSSRLTVYDLIFQTSGLPDAYEETSNSIKRQVIEKDLSISFEQMVSLVKKLSPHFPPREGNKAFYSDINFDMLGKIIEQITALPLEQAFKKMIFEPLNLHKTYLPAKESDGIPSIYYKDQLLYRPKLILCSPASGGCVSTARELMLFIKAFFGGILFDQAVFEQLSHYRRLQFSMAPIRYGGGYMQIPLGGMATLFQGEGELIGHSGSTGSFAFYHHEKQLFLVGDVNQMASPALPVRLAMQIAMA